MGENMRTGHTRRTTSRVGMGRMISSAARGIIASVEELREPCHDGDFE